MFLLYGWSPEAVRSLYSSRRNQETESGIRFAVFEKNSDSTEGEIVAGFSIQNKN